jgi:transposase
MSRLILQLSAAQLRELIVARDHHPKPYVRERAAALLKVAAGASMRQVAAHGLLKPRHEEALSRWVHAYRARGLAGLLIAKGRGRKPAFSPSATRQPGRTG